MTSDETIKELKIEYLGDSEKMKQAKDVAVKALEELQAHREAWMKVVSEVDQHTEIHSGGEFYIKNFDVKKIIAEYRPKDGDAE
jgi:hypothetical protein